ncbi:MAG: hypothetical protein EX262_01960 [Sphingomonadaceae bacterium]|nr:MAG: hypothetical protein EX262_01960 [Sphingomonadaceae bacterium]
MTAPRILAHAMLLAATLSGCAAAIPLAAAGVMTVGTDAPSQPDENANRAPDLPPSTKQALRGMGISDDAQVVPLAGAASLPAPRPAAVDLDAVTYSAFADYALAEAAKRSGRGQSRPTALLAGPNLVAPKRVLCRHAESSVLVDLDPAQGIFEPTLPAAHGALADALERLRGAGVEVVWSTALTADRAGDVRTWLRDSALDPAGKDRMLLLRYPEDRKQTRRAEAASERCLVAILGDERADFDELFDYLKRPEAASGLDAMLGQGWFLAPVSPAPPPIEGLTQ